ncbi:MAG: ATP-binding cassette domain-containing protein [Proteobacteria bacterium]|nr:ATP-binding cassette domain-containing protein [Pseudomonadota bacterium]
MTVLLAVDGLVKEFRGRGGAVRAVDGVSLALEAGEVVALVGESGCGKTTLARLIVQLERPTGGRVLLDGHAMGSRRAAWRRRARRIQMVFQDPFGSLDPRLSAGAIIAEPFAIHRVGSRGERAARVEHLARAVGLDPAQLGRRPRAFSGGQRQRIAIARAIALDPDLVILDEPLSALDVSVQAQVLQLLLGLRAERKLTYLFISHDLAVVEAIATRVAVMYAGRIVEEAPRDALFDDPRHPYTRLLLASIPRLGQGKRRHDHAASEATREMPRWTGCAFAPRCPRAEDRCRTETPALEVTPHAPGHRAACHFRDEVAR